MQITVEPTPNSLAKKFVIKGADAQLFGAYDNLRVNYQNILNPIGMNRSSTNALVECPLANEIFNTGAFSALFVQNNDEISITIGLKSDETHLWDAYAEALSDIIEAYLEIDEPIFTDGFTPPESQQAYHKRVVDYFRQEHGKDSVPKIYPVLKAIEHMGTIVAMDGGSLKFKSMDMANGEVFVEMTGACSGCSLTGNTLGNMQENLAKTFGIDVKITNVADTDAPITKYSQFAI